MSFPHGLHGAHGLRHSEILKTIGEYAGSTTYLHELAELTNNIPLTILRRIPPSEYLSCRRIAHCHHSQRGDAPMEFEVRGNSIFGTLTLKSGSLLKLKIGPPITLGPQGWTGAPQEQSVFFEMSQEMLTLRPCYEQCCVNPDTFSEVVRCMANESQWVRSYMQGRCESVQAKAEAKHNSKGKSKASASRR